MNPFDLHGPDFLLFYAVFAGAIFLAAYLLRVMIEGGRAPKIDLDPYAIAYLRGGKTEAARVAIISLVDRGLLSVSGLTLKRERHAEPDAVRHSIEKFLLREFSGSRKASDIFDAEGLEEACSSYQSALEKHALLPDSRVTKARTVIVAGALLLLGGVAVVKIGVALSRGRTNFGFLFFGSLIAMVVVCSVCFPRITTRGRTMLQDLRALYAGLTSRAAAIQPGGATIEAMMLAAVFGIMALPAAGFGYARTLFPKAAKNGSGGSGCGASCGSSCGSSCGGGSCGGGCGGCGS
jgi:uncharacterized protein (TIGR04222 family)